MVTLIVSLHVAAGSLALLIGAIPLLSKKGGVTHRKFGRYFVFLMVVVLVTAFLALVFRFNAFLFVLTILSSYLSFSGNMILVRKNNPGTFLEWIASLAALIIASACIYLTAKGYFKTNPVILYPTLAGTILYAGYDLFRLLNPRLRVHQQLWLFEHIAKMSGAYIAIVAAFSGTVLTFLPKPYSQVWASAVGTPLTVLAIVYYYKKIKRNGSIY